MSSKRLPPDVYKNLQKLKLSADTKSGTVEETITLEKPDNQTTIFTKDITNFFTKLIVSFN